MSSLTMLDAIKETERIGKEYTDRKVQEAAGNGGGGSAGNYPPYSGIPRDDLSRDVRSSLEKADSALQPGDAAKTYQTKGDYPTKTEMADAIAAAQMGNGSGAPVNATAIKYTPEDGEETTVAAAITLLSEEKVALTDKVAVSATVSDGVATFKNAKGQSLFTMNIPTGSGTVSGMTEAQVRNLIDTYNFATKSEMPASWTEAQIRNLITGYGYGTGTYSKPSGGIPEIDLAQDVRDKLNREQTAGVSEAMAESLFALLDEALYGTDTERLKESFMAAWGMGNVIWTLQSITASYSGGSVTVGTDTVELSVIVKGNYTSSAGGSKVNNIASGYSISPSTVSEGNNTITVTYQGKTATFDVIGVPPQVDVILSSISATYSGGAVDVGTPVNNLLGIVVTGHYSDGSTQAITGYALSGDITNVGNNTITVTYQGKTTTFVVVGNAIVQPEDPASKVYDIQSVIMKKIQINEDGTELTSSSYAATPYMEIGNNTGLKLSLSSDAGRDMLMKNSVWYDSEKNAISTFERYHDDKIIIGNNEEFTAPNNAYFFRISTHVTNTYPFLSVEGVG